MIPAAGLGRRFEPLSRVVPKELLLLGDRPLLHHALDEGARAGFESALIIASPAKEGLLRGYCQAAEMPLPVDFAIQPRMSGLGDAILRAGLDPPFGVLLPDDVVFVSEHWTRLLEVHRETAAAVLCVRPVEPAQAHRFGIAECLAEGDHLRVRRLLEKPRPGQTESNLAVFGRYVVTEPVLAALRSLKVAGELQLTDGLALAAASPPGVMAVRFEDRILDCGTPAEHARSSALHWMASRAGRDEEGARLNRGLVAGLRRSGLIADPAIAAAFEAVPRHHFLPELPLAQVYRDEAIPIKLESGVPISSSSQPAMMAIMLDQLRLRPGHSVLEIGAGSGYNAGLMSRLVDAAGSGSVVSLDLDQDLVDSARAHLAAAGDRAALVLRGDGILGHPERAPYDRVILTAAATDVEPAWLDQLKPDGLLLLPLALVGGVQKSVALVRRGQAWESVSLRGCGFMPLRGELVEPGNSIQLEPGISLVTEVRRRLDGPRILRWLRSGFTALETGLAVSLEECWGGLRLSLALDEPAFAALNLQAPPAAFPDPPVLLGREEGGRPAYLASCGILDRDGLALLDRDQSSGLLTVRSFGPGTAAAARLMQALRRWDGGGRPDTERMRITVVPGRARPSPAAGEVILERPHSSLVIGRL